MSASSALNVVFAGTPEFAAQHLTALLASHHNVLSVYTQPDRPAGRGKKLHASPVKQVAEAAGLEVQQPLNFRDPAAQQVLADYGADVMVVVAYGLLLPQVILATPRLGCINVHASLLPRWRGAAPIQRAIEAGDSHTGVTIMQMDIGLDTGAMLHTSDCPILDGDTAADLHDRLALLGPPALLHTLNEMAENRIEGRAQRDDLATYARKLSKEEAQIDWREDAQVIVRRIRAFNPFPVAFTLLDEERVRVHAASVGEQTHHQEPGSVLLNSKRLVVACGNGTSVSLESLQLPGKKAMPVAAILNGLADRVKLGTKLGAL